MYWFLRDDIYTLKQQILFIVQMNLVHCYDWYCGPHYWAYFHTTNIFHNFNSFFIGWKENYIW